jgi:uroporphyrinogen-III synthase
MRLIVTRPEPDASRTAAALARLGHEALVSPMLDIEWVPAAIPPRPYQAVLATSSNAVRALAALAERPFPPSTPLFAVGDRTALEARRAGFAALSAGGDVNELAALVARDLAPGSGTLLYAAGADRAGDLAAQLEALGFAVETTIVYRAVPRARLAPEAEAALRGGAIDGVLLYSRRSAEAFVRALVAAGLAPLSENVTCFCLSPAVAEALPAVASGPVRIAARPEQIRLFALIEDAAGGARGAAAAGGG